jgi:alkylation response protein AidB-like acyl-CoA dehydrogenase
VDLAPSNDQTALQDAVRQTARRVLGAERLLATADSDGWCQPAWDAFEELGLLSLRRAESRGGLGLSLADAALAFEEAGRALLPGPLVATHLALTHEVGQGIASEVDEDGVPLLAHASAADVAVLTRPEGLWVVDVDRLTTRRVERSLDPLTPWSRVDAGLDSALPAGGPGLAAAWNRDTSVLTAAMQVGVAQGVLDLTVEHVATRHQFGAPVGSRQAVKHRLADMLVRLTVSRSAVVAAAVAAEEDPDPAATERAVSSAKLLADAAAVRNGTAAVQMHGAMGFAWESPVHLFLKRAWVLARQGGVADHHAERVAATLAVDTRR